MYGERLRERIMKTLEEMREEAGRCIRLARQTVDDSVASALLAYACELEQRAHLLEVELVNVSPTGPGPAGVAINQVAAR